MENGRLAPYDIRDEKGRLLVAAGTELTDTLLRRLNGRNDWHIDASPPFKLDGVRLSRYRRDYETALERFSTLYRECAGSGRFPSPGLRPLAEFMAGFNQAVPQYAMMGGHGLNYYTQSHSINVAAICALTGGCLKLTKPERDDLIVSGLLHDIGKVRVPDEILLAPRKLTPDEFAVVQAHPVTGAEMLDGFYSREIVNAVKYHHVRIGKGYPGGVEYADLPDLVKWVGTADVIEALTAQRPYRPGMDPYSAMRVLYEEGAVSSDFHITRTFSDIFSRLYIGAAVTLTNGDFGVIREISESGGIYTPLIEVSGGKILTPSACVGIREILGMTQ
jgi:hypothetical protein